MSLDINEKSPWFHENLFYENPQQPLDKDKLWEMAYHYFLKFMIFFRNQPEGSLKPGTKIELSTRMKSRLGVSILFERRMRLNYPYFSNSPKIMPYTIYHEMVHQWLYDCWLDPNHTRRFYNKMAEFNRTGLPVDQEVHIHRRIVSESKIIYQCPACENLFFCKKKMWRKSYCGHCEDKKRGRHYLALVNNTYPPDPVAQHSDIQL